MLLALPAITLIAASIFEAFRSGILVSATSLSLALDIVATFVVLEFLEPEVIFAAFFNKSVAGGVFSINVKLYLYILIFLPVL